MPVEAFIQTGTRTPLAYLVKPFQKNDLIPAIEVAIGRFRELQDDGRVTRGLDAVMVPEALRLFCDDAPPRVDDRRMAMGFPWSRVGAALCRSQQITGMALFSGW